MRRRYSGTSSPRLPTTLEGSTWSTVSLASICREHCSHAPVVMSPHRQRNLVVHQFTFPGVDYHSEFPTWSRDSPLVDGECFSVGGATLFHLCISSLTPALPLLLTIRFSGKGSYYYELVYGTAIRREGEPTESHLCLEIMPRWPWDKEFLKILQLITMKGQVRY